MTKTIHFALLIVLTFFRCVITKNQATKWDCDSHQANIRWCLFALKNYFTIITWFSTAIRFARNAFGVCGMNGSEHDDCVGWNRLPKQTTICLKLPPKFCRIIQSDVSTIHGNAIYPISIFFFSLRLFTSNRSNEIKLSVRFGQQQIMCLISGFSWLFRYLHYTAIDWTHNLNEAIEKQLYASPHFISFYFSNWLSFSLLSFSRAIVVNQIIECSSAFRIGQNSLLLLNVSSISI